MPIALSPSLLFPPISWWQQILTCSDIFLAEGEPFRKMTWVNRYRIATANGPLLLSVPVVGGRTLKAPMSEVLIDPAQDWRKQHWRSLFSAYGRAPFFEHYGPALHYLIDQPQERLAALNRTALLWTAKQLRLQVVFHAVNKPEMQGAESSITRLQATFTDGEKATRYPQVFDDRHGFLPNLSILDLLMNEGPAARQLLEASLE